MLMNNEQLLFSYNVLHDLDLDLAVQRCVKPLGFKYDFDTLRKETILWM